VGSVLRKKRKWHNEQWSRACMGEHNRIQSHKWSCPVFGLCFMYSTLHLKIYIHTIRDILSQHHPSHECVSTSHPHCDQSASLHHLSTRRIFHFVLLLCHLDFEQDLDIAFPVQCAERRREQLTTLLATLLDNRHIWSKPVNTESAAVTPALRSRIEVNEPINKLTSPSNDWMIWSPIYYSSKKKPLKSN